MALAIAFTAGVFAGIIIVGIVLNLTILKQDDWYKR
jgi:hypothetical protein